MIVALRAVTVASIRIVNIALLPAEMIERIPEAKRGKFDIVDMIEAGIEPEAIGAAAEAACAPVVCLRRKRRGRRSAASSRTPRSTLRLSGCRNSRWSPTSASGTRPPERSDMRATVLDKLVKGKRQPEASIRTRSAVGPAYARTLAARGRRGRASLRDDRRRPQVRRHGRGVSGDRGTVGGTCSRARRLPDLAAPRDYLGGKALRQDDRHRCGSILGASPTIDVEHLGRRDLSHH